MPLPWKHPMPWGISVSYTHLDVYKRQVQGHEVIIELVDASADLDGLAFCGNGRYGQAQQHHNRQCQRKDAWKKNRKSF